MQKLQKRWRLGALIVCAMTGCNAILGLRDDYGPADAPDASMDAQVVDTTADVIGDSMMVADAADAGDAGDAAETSTWSPLRLDGLAMWLEASQRIVLDGGNRVAAWRDLSANVNDAVVRLDGGPTHPTYALLNGRPSVRFSSGSLLQVADDNTSLRFGSADFTVLVVGRYTNPPSGNSDALLVGRRCGALGQGWGLYGNSPPAPDTRLVAYVTYNPTYSIDGGYNDGKVRLLGIRRVADNLELRVNGMVASPLHDVMGLSLGETCPLAIGVQTGGWRPSLPRWRHSRDRHRQGLASRDRSGHSRELPQDEVRSLRRTDRIELLGCSRRSASSQDDAEQRPNRPLRS